MDNAVPDAKALPPVATLYQFKLVPVAVRFATVGFVELQKVCGEGAVGVDGAALTVTVTSVGVEEKPFASVTTTV